MEVRSRTFECLYPLPVMLVAPQPPPRVEVFQDDLAEYVAASSSQPVSPPVFSERRWTIGGVVSLSPAPPPKATRRQSLGEHACCPPELRTVASSRWRARRYSLGGDSTANSAAAPRRGLQKLSENVDPQMRFVTVRGGGAKGGGGVGDNNGVNAAKKGATGSRRSSADGADHGANGDGGIPRRRRSRNPSPPVLRWCRRLRPQRG